MDLDVNDDGDINGLADGIARYMPGYERKDSGNEPQLHNGTSFSDAIYTGAQAMRIIIPGLQVHSATFEITDVSKHKGYSGNGIDDSLVSGNDEDFSFATDTNSIDEEGERKIEATVDSTGIWVPIYCKDYGAWCKIEVTLKKQDGTAMGDPFEITLPADANEDLIADVWQKEQVNEWNQQFNLSSIDAGWVDPENQVTWSLAFGAKTTLEQDVDDLTEIERNARDMELADTDGLGTTIMPIMPVAGDGLIALEEYRGFILDGGPGLTSTEHRRLSIARKEALFQFLVMPQITDGSNPGNCANAAAQAFDAAQRFNAVQGFYNAQFQNGGADLDCYMVELPLIPDASATVTYNDGTTRPAYLPVAKLKPTPSSTSGSTRPGNALTCVYYDQRLLDENLLLHTNTYSPDLKTAGYEAFARARSAAEALVGTDALDRFTVCAFYNRFGKYLSAAHWNLGVMERDSASFSNHIGGGTLSIPQIEPTPWGRGCQFAVNSISEESSVVPSPQDFNGLMELLIAHEIGHTLIWARDAGHPGTLPGLMAQPPNFVAPLTSLGQAKIQDTEILRMDLRNRSSVIK